MSERPKIKTYTKNELEHKYYEANAKIKELENRNPTETYLDGKADGYGEGYMQHSKERDQAQAKIKELEVEWHKKESIRNIRYMERLDQAQARLHDLQFRYDELNDYHEALHKDCRRTIDINVKAQARIKELEKEVLIANDQKDMYYSVMEKLKQGCDQALAEIQQIKELLK